MNGQGTGEDREGGKWLECFQENGNRTQMVRLCCEWAANAAPCALWEVALTKSGA